MHAPMDGLTGFHSQLTAFFWDAGLKSFEVLALAGMICALGRRAAAATRHLIWCVAMASLLCVPLLSSFLPAWERPLWSVSSGTDSGNQISLALELPATSKSTEAAPVTTVNGTGATQMVSADHRKLTTRFNLTWLTYGLAAWAIGVALVLLRTGGGLWRLRNFSRTAQTCDDAGWIQLLDESQKTLRLRRPVKLLQSSQNVMPLTWGWWRPVVMLPSDAAQWPEERRRIVLLHELAHAKRWDCLTQFIARIICAFYWFNPLAWLAARQMASERERACDDLVLTGGCKASDYAGHLVDIAGSFPRLPQTAAIAMARPTGLEERVAAIVDHSRPRSLHPATLLAILLAAAGTAFFAGGCKTQIAGPSPNASLREQQFARLAAFSKLKEKQSETLAAAAGETISPEFRRFFDAAIRGDYSTVTNMSESFQQRHPQYEHKKGYSQETLRTSYWSPAMEICLAYDQVSRCAPEYTQLAVDGIMNSIPPGSIYFGGTDPGRGLPTAFSRSQPEADPFYILTQNALADETYLEYLRQTYGSEKNLLAAEIAARRSDPAAQALDAKLNSASKKLYDLEAETGPDDPRYLTALSAWTGLHHQHDDLNQSIRASVRAQAEAQKAAGGQDLSATTLRLPTASDAGDCFRAYVEEAQKRYQSHQLKPGEEYSEVDGRTQIGGVVAVMSINGLLIKWIFDHNPGHEYYIEESYPLDWMYPYLEPHGLIMKLDREPMAELSGDTVQKDQDYWQGLVSKMIGGWLTRETSVPQVAAFAKKVFQQHDLTGFNGDPNFVQNDDACRMFSKLRAAIAGIYAWRAEHATESGEKEHMAQAADLAFRQALALCPYFPEIAKRYADFLNSQQRTADAALITDLSARLNPKKPALLQVRLVLDAPTTDSETLTNTTNQRNAMEILYAQKTVLLDQDDIKSARADEDSMGKPDLNVHLTPAGQKRFADFTRDNVGKRVAVFVDGQIRTVPKIESEIPNGDIIITGTFSQPEAKALAAKMNAVAGK